jgi:predicted transglutaminase-like cysteine proteinase
MKQEVIQAAEKYAYDIDNAKSKLDEITAKKVFKETINNLFSLQDVGYCLPDKETMISEMKKVVEVNYKYNTEIEKANFRIGWQEYDLWLKNRYK